jgi:sugar phosphate isomerase/epimerase
MSGISRREFGAVVLAAGPLAAVLRAAPRLTVGVATSSFRELPRVTGRDNLDDILAALRTVRTADIELALANLEPAPPSVEPFMGGTPAYPRLIIPTPEEIAATNAWARADLRTWRLATDLSHFTDVRRRLGGAGVTVHGCAVPYDDSLTDDEIDATFRQVRALGVRTIGSPLTMAMAKRLAPFAERHEVAVAIHNQAAGNAGQLLSTATIRPALALSPAFRVKLDIGHITASNGNAVEELGELASRVSSVVIRDRLRNGGRSQPFGEGDTPIREVIRHLQAAGPAVPVLIDYDYIGLRSAVDEVMASMDYLLHV